MKKSLKAFLAFALAILLLPTANSLPAQAVDRDVPCAEGGGTFKIVGTTITSSTTTCKGDIVIPADVTEIGYGAFEARQIKNVTFEAGSQLNRINNVVFGNNTLTSIDLPDGLQFIGNGVFSNTGNLRSISIPGTVTSIGPDLAYDAALETIVFEPRVASTLTLSANMLGRARNMINAITFMAPGPTVSTELTPWGRTGFTWGGWSTSVDGPRVTFPVNMGTADSALYPRWIPDTITVHNCGTAGTFEVRNGVAGGASSTCVGDVLIPAQATFVDGFQNRNISNVTFEPNSQVRSFGDYAFNGSKLSSIDLPDGLETIPYWALRNTKLTSVSIPGSVKSLRGLLDNPLLEYVVVESRIAGAGTLNIDSLNGNSKLKSLTFMGATQLSGSPTVVKAVNTWLGWSTSEGGSVVAFPSSVVAGTTLFPRYSPRTYTVTFNTLGGTDVAPAAIVGGEFQMPTPPTRNGYTFWKWVYNPSDPGSGDVGVIDHYSDSNLLLYAMWKANTYVVNYVPNGGPAIAPGSFKAGSYLYVASPSRAGYRWDGWSLIDGGPMVANDMYTPGVFQDITLYGRWIPNSWNVYWEDTYGAPIPQATFLSGGTIQAAPVPTRVGHRFDGWRVTYNGSPPPSSDPVLSFPYTPNVVREIWMYSKWTRLWQVTYKNMGTDVTSSFFAQGESIDAAPVVPLRAGYTLSWSKTQDGGEVVSFPYTPGVSGNISLHAKWTPNLNSVIFDSKGGSPVPAGTFLTDSAIMAALNAPGRPGYTFQGWAATEGGAAVSFPYLSGATSDITLFAEWTPNLNAVSFDSKGGSPVPAGTFFTDVSVQAPLDAPSRPGYTLQGWSATDGGDVVSFPYLSGSTSDITLFAKWDANTYAVNLNAKGGSSVPALSFRTDGSVSSAPATPIRAGYTFQGWSATDGGDVVSFPYAPGVIENITLYAKWDANTYAVNLNTNGGLTMPAVSFRTDGVISSAPTTPIRVGYTFQGWSAIYDGVAVTFPYAPGVIEDITLYATWIRDPYKPELKANATVSGSGLQSTPLTAATGTWDAYPEAAVTVQWYRCDKVVAAGLSALTKTANCVPVAGATRASYKVVVPDAGKYLTPLVTAKNRIGTTVTTSRSFLAPKLAAPSRIQLPVVTGSAIAKQYLSATVGTWKSNPVAKTSTQWFRCEKATRATNAPVAESSDCTAIKGAKATRYRLVADDEGMFVTSQVTAVNTEGTAVVTASSTRVALTPSSTNSPVISGTAMLNKSLTASTGSWEAFPAPKTSVQWYRCGNDTSAGEKKFSGSSRCTPIRGATKNRYTVTAADKDKYISVLVTAVNTAGKTTVTAESAQVAYAPTKTGNPSISGSASVDKTLTATPGRWSAFPEASTSFKWYRCSSPAAAGAEKFTGASGCSPIGGASDSRYTVTEADRGKYIAVLVKASNSAGSTSATSKSTSKVG